MKFGEAIENLKKGKRVTRKGWNGKGMYLEMQNPDDHSKMTRSYIYMKTVNDDLVPWVASQSDMIEEDWELVKPDPIKMEDFTAMRSCQIEALISKYGSQIEDLEIMSGNKIWKIRSYELNASAPMFFSSRSSEITMRLDRFDHNGAEMEITFR